MTKFCVVPIIAFLLNLGAMEIQRISGPEERLGLLFDDFGKYAIEDKPGREPSSHRMNLAGHSLAVYQFLRNWMQENRDWVESEYCGCMPNDSIWCKDLSDREKEIFCLAAAIHDIGKGGEPTCRGYKLGNDGRIYFSGKRDHELIGFYQIISTMLDESSVATVRERLINYYKIDSARLQPYVLVSGEKFDCSKFFDHLELTTEERQKIAALVGAHKIFTQVYAVEEEMQKIPGNPTTRTIASFWRFLNDLKVMAGGELGIDKNFIEMVIALTAADLYAVFFTPEKFTPSTFVDSGLEQYFGPRRDFANQGFEVDGKSCDERTRRVWYCNKAIHWMQEYRIKLLEILGQK